MRLLIITQKIDISDDNLGFFHRWVEEFAKHCESMIIICLQKGGYNLPSNVRVLSLGKELEIGNWKLGILKKLKYIFNFYQYIRQERNNYDAVFVHMNPEYILLGGLFWRIFKKKISLWYAHGTVTWRVWAAKFFSHIIFTSSKSGFRLSSPKLIIIGQGIDTDLFRPNLEKKVDTKLRIISVGRIAPIKHYEQIIEAAIILNNKNIPFEITIAGQPLIAKDQEYFKSLQKQVARNNLNSKIHFIGPIPFNKVADLYRNYDLFINASDTGSLDKAVLEAMASGLIILTANEAYKDIIPPQCFISHDPKEIAASIIQAANGEKISMREYVIKNHGLKSFIAKISERLNNFTV